MGLCASSNKKQIINSRKGNSEIKKTKTMNNNFLYLRTSKTFRVCSLANTMLKEINYSAKRVKKYFMNQPAYTESNSNEKFIDPYFPPNFNSIIGKNSKGEFTDLHSDRVKEALDSFKITENEIEWYRAEEIFGGKENYALFEGKVEFDDVRQGSIGNCYFMASLSALTEVPEVIFNIFRHLEVQESGYYEVCFKIDGEWNVIIVDDYFPCSKTTKKPLFANPNNNEIWPLILEKAWAKANGGYMYTVSGIA